MPHPPHAPPPCRRLHGIPGASVEHNTFCVSAHFRNCATDRWQDVMHIVEEVVAGNELLRITRGRKVLEVRPKVGGGVGGGVGVGVWGWGCVGGEYRTLLNRTLLGG